ncbi:MAG: CDP-diacylglycerol--glycerol-3-phosphate 3-phosphatidyltransferase [Chlamydiia bacterium]|nr:CDP-diacylglycerol--glycerol-3-phosphate 3-phosphatidyltransferase [Chlamydiia bacterium]
MFTPSNIISFLRLPLAILFLLPNPLLRATLIVIAMITDVVDGYLARRFSLVTRFGAFLDPIMDKFFVLFVIGTLVIQNALSLPEGLLLISRDFALLGFLFYLLFTNSASTYRYGAIRWGKVTTALQFILLFLVSLGYHPPFQTYYTFLLLTLVIIHELASRLPTRVRSETLK